MDRLGLPLAGVVCHPVQTNNSNQPLTHRLYNDNCSNGYLDTLGTVLSLMFTCGQAGRVALRNCHGNIGRLNQFTTTGSTTSGASFTCATFAASTCSGCAEPYHNYWVHSSSGMSLRHPDSWHNFVDVACLMGTQLINHVAGTQLFCEPTGWVRNCSEQCVETLNARFGPNFSRDNYSGGRGRLLSVGCIVSDLAALNSLGAVSPPTAIPTTSMRTPTATPTVSPTSGSSALGDSGGGGGGGNDLSVGVAVGVTIAGFVVGVGVFICKRRRGQRQHLPPQSPQSQIVSMFVNPLHHSVPEPTTDYENPAMLQPPESPCVDVDSELYVADQRASPAEGQYAVFRSTALTEETGPLTDSATYHVFRSEGLAENPDATA